MSWFLSLLLLCVVGNSVAQSGIDQVSLSGQDAVAGTAAKLDLASIGNTDAFTVLTHPNFPAHQLRVKKTNFCDPTVKYDMHHSSRCGESAHL